jgi:iron complex transport system permease protein
MTKTFHLSGQDKYIAPHRNRRLIFSGLVVLLLIFMILDIFLGSVSIRPGEVIRALTGNGDLTLQTIILKFRLPKAATAVFVGLALSLSGLQMQTIFRNPMAGPYVLGISSGASLGVAFVVLGFSGVNSPSAFNLAGNWILVAASWAGAGAVMLLIFFISARVKDIMTILIIGIMLSSGISAIVTVMQYFSNESMLKAYVIWTMGSLGNLTSSQMNVLIISVLAGVCISFASVKMLNALLLGEVYAGSIGLNVKSARVVIFASTCILAGSVTAFCGPVAFIGIAVPHLAKMIFSTSDHRVLVPATVLSGAVVMLVSDIISQLPGYNSVLPVNSVTSLIGIPVVLWIILRGRRYTWTL